MSCKPTYKGVRYNSVEDLKSSIITPQQKQQALKAYSQYLEQNPNGNIEGFKKFTTQSSTSVAKEYTPESQLVTTQTSKKSSNNLVISELKRNFEGYKDSLSKLGINTIEDFDKLSLQEEEELVKKLCNP